MTGGAARGQRPPDEQQPFAHSGKSVPAAQAVGVARRRSGGPEERSGVGHGQRCRLGTVVQGHGDGGGGGVFGSVGQRFAGGADESQVGVGAQLAGLADDGEVNATGVVLLVVRDEACETVGQRRGVSAQRVDRALGLGQPVVGEGDDWTMGEHERYDSLMATMIKRAKDAEERGLKPVDAAQVISDAITADTPQTRYLLGDAEAIAQAADELSDHDLDQMIAGMLG